MVERRRWSDLWDRMINREEPDPLEVIRAAAMYQRYFVAVEEHAARLARQRGATWEEIGRAAGVTRQAVWQRFRTVSVPVRFRKLHVRDIQNWPRLDDLAGP